MTRYARIAPDQYVTFQPGAGGGSGAWVPCTDPFTDGGGAPVPGAEPVADAESRFLSPCQPAVVFGVAHNGEHHLPPQAFMKSAHTVTGPGGQICLQPGVGTTNVEGELAVVIGREARNLTLDNALDHVLGYTLGNDVTALEQTPLDDLLTQTKNGDGYTPLGPWIETDFDPLTDHEIRVSVDGVQAVSGHSNTMRYTVADMLVYLTHYTTLKPGDVLLAGSPTTWTPAVPGQVVDIEIDGLGRLSNPVAADPARTDDTQTIFQTQKN